MFTKIKCKRIKSFVNRCNPCIFTPAKNELMSKDKRTLEGVVLNENFHSKQRVAKKTTTLYMETRPGSEGLPNFFLERIPPLISSLECMEILGACTC